MKYLVLALLALTALCAVEARMIPIGFHGAIAGNLDSLLTQLKTQEELGATDSQILGPGTYFGITPGIAIEYAHTRMKNFNVHDSIVAILGIDEAHFKMGLKNDVKTGIACGADIDTIKQLNVLYSAALIDYVEKRTTYDNLGTLEKVFKMKPTPGSRPFKKCGFEFAIKDAVIKHARVMGYFKVAELDNVMLQKGAKLFRTVSLEGTTRVIHVYPNSKVDEKTQDSDIAAVRLFFKFLKKVCMKPHAWFTPEEIKTLGMKGDE